MICSRTGGPGLDNYFQPICCRDTPAPPSAANALNLPVWRPSGVHAALMTAIRIGAAMLLPFTIVHGHDPPLVHESRKAQWSAAWRKGYRAAALAAAAR